jgi:hypothetical protein
VSLQPWRYSTMLLGLFLLLGMVGCAVERGRVYVKDGKQYGVTSGQIWRGRWWNYYERGVSYADGEFWDEALVDFQAAIQRRQEDQRRARTYGLHFIDYFPHRELGIVYYRLDRYPEAIHELETSLATVDNAKAKFYLNRARKSLLQQTGRDTVPPRIVLTSPADGLLTNRFTVTVAGRAEDDTYVSAVTINGRSQFVELAEPRLPFTQEIALHDGANIVDVAAVDLLGQQVHQRLTVRLDRHGPLVSLDRVEVVGTPPQQRVQIEGWLADSSQVAHFVVAGRQMPLRVGTEWEFRLEVPVAADAEALPFEVEDAAGNVTRGEIALTPPASGPIREGKVPFPLPLLLPRWASLAPGTVISDLVALPATPIRTAQRRDRYPPVIKLRGLADRETVYDDVIYLEVQVTDASAITAFSVNGESLWRRHGKQLFFSQLVPLQPGENTIVLEAVDEVGNTAQHPVVVTREARQVQQVGSRLRVSLLPFAKNGSASRLAESVYDNLFNVLVNQRRFDFVERQHLEAILQEHKLSQTVLVDPATAARTGKLMAAEGMLIGTVTETPQSLEVFARFVDVETSVVLAALDVYGEDLTLQSLRTLIEGIGWKLQRDLPLVEGVVINRAGQILLTDLTASHGIKRYMKLIVFRAGEDLMRPPTGRLLKKDTILGEARITAVSADLSEATLLQAVQAGDVQELDQVITK